jgi:hypothetical protein
VTKILSKNIILKSQFEDTTESNVRGDLEPGHYSIIGCTFEPANEAKFKFNVFTNKKIRVPGRADEPEPKEEAKTEAAAPAAKPDLPPRPSTRPKISLDAYAATDKPKDEAASSSKDPEKKEKHKDKSSRDKKEKSSRRDRAGSSAADTKKVDDLTAKYAASQQQVDELTKLVESLKSQLAASGAKSPRPSLVTPRREGTDALVEDVGPFTGTDVLLQGQWKGKTAGGCFNHQTWRSNPQYFLTIKQQTKIVITLTQEGKGNFSSIGFYVIKPKHANKRVVYLGEDPEDFIEGKASFTNTAKASLEISLAPTKAPYVILPCTFTPGEEKGFTLSVVASSDVTIQKDGKEHDWNSHVIKGEWKEETAGGCKNHASFLNNPQYLLTVQDKTKLDALLLQQEEEDFDPISFYIIKTEGATQKLITVKNDDIILKGKFASPTDCGAEIELTPGKYVVVPCTFDPNKESSFTLYLWSTKDIKMDELTNAKEISVQGEWKGKTAGGCLNHPFTWRNNPQFLMTVSQPIDLDFRLRQSEGAGGKFQSIGFYIVKGAGKRRLTVTKDDIVSKAGFATIRDMILTQHFEPNENGYIIVPCTFKPGQEANFSFSIFSKFPGDFTEVVTLTPLPDIYTIVDAQGEWKGITAGGCLNHSTWRNNPQFNLQFRERGNAWLSLSVPVKEKSKDKDKKDKDKEKADLSIGFYLVKAPFDGGRTVEMEPKDIIKKGAFRKGSEVLINFDAEPGDYNIVTSTFAPGQESPFTVTVYSETPAVKMNAIEQAFLTKMGKWDVKSAGGCINDHERWMTNPRYFLLVKQPVKLCIVLVQSPNVEVVNPDEYAAVGFYVTNSDEHGLPKTTDSADLIAKANFEQSRDVSCVVDFDPSPYPYVITPSTFYPDVYLDYQLSVIGDPESLKYVKLSDNPQSVNIEEFQNQRISPEILVNRIRARVDTCLNACKDLKYFIDGLGVLDLLEPYVDNVQVSVEKFLMALVATANGEDPVPLTPRVVQVSSGYEEEPAVDSPAPVAPPPPPIGGPSAPPPPPPMIKTERAPRVVADTGSSDSGPSGGDLIAELGSGLAKLKKVENVQKKPANIDVQAETMNAIKGGKFNLKKVSDRPVEKPKAAPSNTWGMEQIVARRMAIEGEDWQNEKEDDWEQEWED